MGAPVVVLACGSRDVLAEAAAVAEDVVRAGVHLADGVTLGIVFFPGPGPDPGPLGPVAGLAQGAAVEQGGSA